MISGSIPKAGTVTCPAGHSAPDRDRSLRQPASALATLAVQRLPAQIDAAWATHSHKKLEILPEEELLIAARQTLDDPAHRGAPTPNTAADRATARPARLPLPRPPDPVHRQRQEPATGSLDRRRGQPQPDQPPTGHTNHLRARDPRHSQPGSPIQRPTTRAIATADPTATIAAALAPTHSQTHFFSALLGARRHHSDTPAEQRAALSASKGAPSRPEPRRLVQHRRPPGARCPLVGSEQLVEQQSVALPRAEHVEDEAHPI